jgi:protein-disulfide isomerase
MVKTGTAFVLTAIALVGGFALGRISSGGKFGSSGSSDEVVVASADEKEIAGTVERIKVAADGPSKGADDALVTIVEYSDFQCPFCSRVGPTIERIMKEYPQKVRVVFKHNPLPFHADAPLAAEATMAAHEQGKFWEMHDKLFANQQAIKRENLDTYAKDIGLDVGKFKQALDTNKFKPAVQADLAAGSSIGVQGTPNFFVNGRKIEGAVPFENFKTVIDDELIRAEKLVAKGTPKNQVYAKLMASVSAAPAAAPAAAAPAAPAARPAVSDEVFKVEIDGSPLQGAKEPKVVIVSFSDFQCPFCSRVLPTLKQIADNYKNDVAFSFKHLPLEFHQNATPAAQATEAARLQGKFWEMHDKLFANQQALSVEDFDKYAKEIGLNVSKFKTDFASKEVKDRIDRDKTVAAKFGARGTPSFFINGRVFRGAQPYDAFKTVVDEEIKKADAKIAAGASRKNLYAEIIKNGKTEAAAEAPAAAPAGAPPAGARVAVPVGNSPTKGPADALITIVIFSDYQCPFCSRVEPTLKQVADEYKGKVRFVWKDLPLPFHANAKPAAYAAMAAGEQGKFWEMHDKLFANQQALSPEDFDKYAQELGLNLSKFKAAQTSEKVKQAVEDGATLAGKIGASGTPAFFINGILLSGAQPYAAFKGRIDEELTKAEELVKKGTPKNKVYEAIMKEAASAPPPAPAAAAAEAGPENDQTVTKIDPGNSPSRGPKNAPITLVVFSEFQCPFCSRVKPSIDAIWDGYKGKVRVVFKHFPLDFHPNARPAAQASMAANEQGKFWEMHDKLFANQQNLDRPSLDKYAQEIGLNMDKFKAAMDSSKFTALIDEDVKLGQSVGVNGTPATFVNGRKIGGAYPPETFKKIVEQELAKKKG